MLDGCLRSLAAPLWCFQTSTQTTADIMRSVRHTHDAYEMLIQKAVVPSTQTLRVTVDLLPNAHVQIAGKEIMWTDAINGAAQTRTEGSGYDTRWRFSPTRSNPKNHTETFSFDDETGAAPTRTDANRRITGWQYNQWRRKLHETRPDGTATSWDYVSCVSACGYGVVRQWSGTSQTQVLLERFSDLRSRSARAHSGNAQS